VVERPVAITEHETEAVRRGLRTMTENERRVLWNVLEVVDPVLASGGTWDRLVHAILLAPTGVVRDTVHQVAELRYTRASQPNGAVGIPKLSYKPALLTTVLGRAADADCWTAAWTWSSFSPDALGDIADRTCRDHQPLEVRYRHQPGNVLGLTRHWRAAEDGGLDVEFSLLPTARAQYAGRCMCDRTLRGLSLATRSDRADWCFVSPGEWEPLAGRLDLTRHQQVTPVELSVTPSPAQGEHAQVRAIF
jgi:hypothetical protein